MESPLQNNNDEILIRRGSPDIDLLHKATF